MTSQALALQALTQLVPPYFPIKLASADALAPARSDAAHELSAMSHWNKIMTNSVVTSTQANSSMLKGTVMAYAHWWHQR
jgi:hypothetical protein